MHHFFDWYLGHRPSFKAMHVITSQMDRQKVATCISLLEEQYGIPRLDERDPVDLLVMTILSQNTSDTNSLRAFAHLKSAFCDYEEILADQAGCRCDLTRLSGGYGKG